MPTRPNYFQIVYFEINVHEDIVFKKAEKNIKKGYEDEIDTV